MYSTYIRRSFQNEYQLDYLEARGHKKKVLCPEIFPKQLGKITLRRIKKRRMCKMQAEHWTRGKSVYLLYYGIVCNLLLFFMKYALRKKIGLILWNVAYWCHIGFFWNWFIFGLWHFLFLSCIMVLLSYVMVLFFWTTKTT
jgi:hypothetical protein